MEWFAVLLREFVDLIKPWLKNDQRRVIAIFVILVVLIGSAVATIYYFKVYNSSHGPSANIHQETHTDNSVHQETHGDNSPAINGTDNSVNGPPPGNSNQGKKSNKKDNGSRP